jgi:prepilin-type processing-associated H-X9-DG protein
MRQIGLALFTAQDQNGSMPPFSNQGGSRAYSNPNMGIPASYTRTNTDGSTTVRTGGWTNGSWTGGGSTTHMALLQFIDEQNLLLQWSEQNTLSQNPKDRADNGYDRRQQVATPKLYLCPSDPTGTASDGRTRTNDYATNYPVNYHVFNGGSDQGLRPKVPSSFPDGAAKTILVYERYGYCPRLASVTGGDANWVPRVWDGGGSGPWHPVAYGPPLDGWAAPTLPVPVFQEAPTLTACDGTNTQGMHNGQNVLFGDGSVRLITSRINADTWSAMATPNNRDIVGSEN